MFRTCIALLVLWPAISLGYFYLLRDVLPLNGRAIASAVMGGFVWFGLVTILGVRHSIRDWRARNRLARGERPRDGDVAAAVGTIHPAFEALRSPLSGKECVIYSYEVGVPRSGDSHARDYFGSGMTRCAIRTQYGEFLLGSFPVLEGFFKNNVDSAAGAEFVSTTSFEPIEGIAGITKMALGLYTQAPPLRKDWKFGTPEADLDTAEVQELIVAPGEMVTALGRYSAGANALVADTNEKGFLRLHRGGKATKVQSVPWNAIGAFFGGLLSIGVANLVLWALLQKVTQ